MEKIIDGYHIRVSPSKNKWKVYPNKRLLPFFMQWNKDARQWKFIEEDFKLDNLQYHLPDRVIET